jgi:hypothetical protein
MNKNIFGLTAENTIQNVKNRPGAGAGAAIRNFGSGSSSRVHFNFSSSALGSGSAKIWEICENAEIFREDQLNLTFLSRVSEFPGNNLALSCR